MALNLRGIRAEQRTRLFQLEGRAHAAVWMDNPKDWQDAEYGRSRRRRKGERKRKKTLECSCF